MAERKAAGTKGIFICSLCIALNDFEWQFNFFEHVQEEDEVVK